MLSPLSCIKRAQRSITISATAANDLNNRSIQFGINMYLSTFR